MPNYIGHFKNYTDADLDAVITNETAKEGPKRNEAFAEKARRDKKKEDEKASQVAVTKDRKDSRRQYVTWGIALLAIIVAALIAILSDKVPQP